jgi:hypothetical protein
MSSSRYVSEELVHFVGRTAASDEAAYERVVTIVQDGWLLSHNARKRDQRNENIAAFELRPAASLNSNDRYIPEMICFADIPTDALRVHTPKYGRFGLGFNKRFLIPKGARPVYYVPRGAKTQPMAKYDEIAEDWDELAELFVLEVDPRFGGTTRSGQHGSADIGEAPAGRIADWVGHDWLAHVKFFDPNLPEDHADNYYMEREWRCVRSIRFGLSDVTSVFVAPGFGPRLAKRFPTLAARVHELP